MKFKRGISFVLSIILFMVIFVGNNESAFAATKEMNIWNGGSDTKWYDENSSATEFNISTSEELAGLANIVNSGKDSFVGKTINLTNDLYLNNTDNVDSWTNSNKDLNAWTAIGNGTNSFKGTFNGNGYSINGLYSVDLNNKNYIGIFGSVDGGTIKNLCVEKSYKYGGLYSGFIAGNISNNSIVENCFSSGVSTSTKYSGGIVGRSLLSNISNCYYNGKISGSYSGGIVGSATGGSTSNCRNYASIKCEITGLGNHIKVGGIVGECLDNTIINNSYNYGEILFDKNNSNLIFLGGVCAGNRCDNKLNVSIDGCVNYGNIKYEGTSNSETYIGGVCGLGFAKISNSSNKADMNITSSNNYKIGGILGSTHWGTNPIEQNISNCYNVGNLNISGKGCTLGGVLGQQYNGTKMENTYSSGIINNSSSRIIAGILVGVKRTNSYNDKTTSIITNSYGIKNESINNLYRLIASNDNNTNIMKNNVDVFNKIDNVLTVDLLEILNKYAKDNNYATFRQGTEKEGYFPQFESYNVSSEIDNIKIIGEEHLAWDENYAGILVAENGAELPKEFRIISNNRVLEEGVDYTYNSENGLIRINNLTSDGSSVFIR